MGSSLQPRSRDGLTPVIGELIQCIDSFSGWAHVQGCKHVLVAIHPMLGTRFRTSINFSWQQSIVNLNYISVLHWLKQRYSAETITYKLCSMKEKTS